MTDLERALLAEALREAIDSALDEGATPDEIKAEIAYQLENYDRSPA